MSDEKRFFITKFRLKKDPEFHKTVEMCKTVNPDQKIWLPPKTKEWLEVDYGWTELSPANLVMCWKYIDYEYGNPTFRWSEDPEKANEIFDYILGRTETDQYKDHVLRSGTIKESTIYKFLTDQIKIKNRDTEYLALKNILDRTKLKAYQYEMIWEKLKGRKELKDHLDWFVLGGRYSYDDSNSKRKFKMQTIPDYCLEEMVKAVMKELPKKKSYTGGYYSDAEATFDVDQLVVVMKEATRRKFFEFKKPSEEVVKPYKPTTLDKILAEEKNEKEKDEEKSKA